MNATMVWLRRVFGGDAPAGPPSPAVQAVAAVFLVGCLAVLGYVARDAWLHRRVNPVDAEKVELISRMGKIDRALQAADATGDRTAATVLIRDTLELVIRLDELAGKNFERWHYCEVAAGNLNEAALRLSDGGRWLDQDRFEAALKACST